MAADPESGRSAALSLYYALAARGETLAARNAPASQQAERTGRTDRARPPTPVVWVHGATGEDVAAVTWMAPRLGQLYGAPVTMLATTDSEAGPPGRPEVIHQIVPYDTPLAADRFLDHWQMGCGITVGNAIRPVLLQKAQERGIPLILANAALPQRQPIPVRQWLARASLPAFSAILAAEPADIAAMGEMPRHAQVVKVTGRIEEGGLALGHDPALRDRMSAALAHRPVWLAAGISASEAEVVLAAHRRAIRASHRLLLVIVPGEGVPAQAIADAAAEEGWTLARRSVDDLPEHDTQVLVADTGSQSELGLWYRLAPISFIGNTLRPSGAGPAPFDAAALGSAVLHGPYPGPHKRQFERLTAGEAARLVLSPGGLASGVMALLNPDAAARVAGAAWGIVSEGAEAADTLIDLMARALDEGAVP